MSKKRVSWKKILKDYELPGQSPKCNKCFETGIIRYAEYSENGYQNIRYIKCDCYYGKNSTNINDKH